MVMHGYSVIPAESDRSAFCPIRGRREKTPERETGSGLRGRAARAGAGLPEDKRC